MAHFYFNPVTNRIKLKFNCPFCKEQISINSLDIPEPDFSAETHRESINSEYITHICPKCEKEIEIQLHNGFNGGNGIIPSLEADSYIEIEEEHIEDRDWEYEYIEEHVRDIAKVIDSLDDLNIFSQRIIYRNLYVNLIAIMEAYLYETILHRVLASYASKRKFVENYHNYQEIQISFSNIFKKIDNIDSFIIQTLDNLLYHNLPLLKPIFKSTSDIDLGDISKLIKPINIRHDLVHRNGKDKDGNEHLIGKDDVLVLLEEISKFISNIEQQVNPMFNSNLFYPFNPIEK